MSSGWQSVGRCAAGLLAQAARHASHASTSTSAASSGEPAARSALQQALSCGQWRQPGGGGGGHGGGCGGGAPVRGLSTSAAPAAQTLPEEPDEPHEDQRDRELEEQLGDPGQVSVVMRHDKISAAAGWLTCLALHFAECLNCAIMRVVLTRVQTPLPDHA